MRAGGGLKEPSTMRFGGFLNSECAEPGFPVRGEKGGGQINAAWIVVAFPAGVCPDLAYIDMEL
jgi:hypothetical protein